jgi:glycosyltransferase involved in cell wall biosynthesis
VKFDNTQRVLVISDSYPTNSHKRSGIFGFDDFVYYKSRAEKAKMLILFRKTIQRTDLFSISSAVRRIREQLEEIEFEIRENGDVELIPYVSLIKPFVFKEDLFLSKRSVFSDDNFDIVIVHSTVHTGLNIGWIRRQFRRCKIVLKVHSDWTLFPGTIRYFTLRAALRYDEVWANSENTASKIQLLLRQQYQDSRRLPVLLVDYPKFHINQEVIEKKTDVTEVLTVANLIEAKGYRECFGVLSILEKANINWHWTIVGAGVFYEGLLLLIEKYFFRGKISIVSEAPKTVVHELMRKSNVYLQLSHRESFGIAPIEAFTFCNKVIVSDKIPSICELGLGANENVFVITDIAELDQIRSSLCEFVLSPPDWAGFQSGIRKIMDKCYN